MDKENIEKKKRCIEGKERVTDGLMNGWRGRRQMFLRKKITFSEE